jgi:hypothetical protein
MKRKIYQAIIYLAVLSLLITVAYVAWIYSVYVTKSVANPLSLLGRGTSAFLVIGALSMLEGLAVPLYPVLGGSWTGMIATAAIAALLTRRLLVWRRFRSKSPPETFGSFAAFLLGLCLVSLLIALVGTLSAPFAAAANQGIAYVFRLFGALHVPALLSLPAKYLLGVTLLVVELQAIGREGWWPRPSTAAEAAPIAPVVARRNFLSTQGARVGVGIAVAIMAVFAGIWSVFPTGMFHARLCQTRAGEHVYEKAAGANSYLFVGEGASTDGLHMREALLDVANRRVQFIEIQKVSGNHHQANAFGSMTGNHDPKGSVFRVAIGPADSAECVKRQRFYNEPADKLQPGECLRMVAVDKPASRYRVEAVHNESAAWYLPHLRTDGSRVIDSEGGKLLGEDLIFANTSMLAFFTLGEKRMECPARYGRKPAGLHRKILLGDG